jgi:hypothetical protein
VDNDISFGVMIEPNGPVFLDCAQAIVNFLGKTGKTV